MLQWYGFDVYHKCTDKIKARGLVKEGAQNIKYFYYFLATKILIDSKSGATIPVSAVPDMLFSISVFKTSPTWLDGVLVHHSKCMHRKS